MSYTIFKDLLAKIEKRQYAAIKIEDYIMLVHELLNISNAANLNGDEIFKDCIDLRDWIYNRVDSDIKYQDTGYLNDHFCIGTIYGIFLMFDDLVGC